MERAKLEGCAMRRDQVQGLPPQGLELQHRFAHPHWFQKANGRAGCTVLLVATLERKAS